MRQLSRRRFLALTGTGALAAACAPRLPLVSEPASRLLYVGTYTRGRSEGIYLCRMDTRTGAVTTHGVVKGVTNPSYLALSPSGARLYAVNEVEDYGGAVSGAVTTLAVEPGGGLRPLGQVSSRGGAPCYITVDRRNRFVLVANYSGGNVAVMPIGPDGTLGEATTVVQHQPRPAAPERKPLAHCIQLDRDDRFAILSDKGLDQLAVYRWDPATGALVAAGSAPLPTGSGPRHFAFAPDGRWVYSVHEQASRITAFRYDPGTGALAEAQTLSTLPADYTGRNSCADVHVHPSGRFVYSSNRGHDSIAVFAVARDGALSPVQHQSTLGRTPRNFTLDPGGRFLLAANQNSDSVATFAIDPATGRLSETGHVADVPVPVCLLFA